MADKTFSSLAKGTWNSATAYTVGDIVDRLGSSYVCITNNTNQAPPNATYWALLASKGADGAGTGDVVGPDSAINSNLASFNTTTGKLIKDSGIGQNNVATLSTNQTFTGIKTFTTGLLKVSDILDTVNALKVIVFSGVGAAVNWIQMTNAATGAAPIIEPAGSDDNIDLEIRGKGTGKIKKGAGYGAIITLSGITPTIDCSLGNYFEITLSGNTTFSISNASRGQAIIIRVKQGTGTTYTCTWFAGITWITGGGIAPSQTTISNGITTYGFICTETNTYDGYLVGTN